MRSPTGRLAYNRPNLQDLPPPNGELSFAERMWERFGPALFTMITVRRLYPAGNTTTISLSKEEAEKEIEHNRQFRPGCSVWVSDGRRWVQHGVGVDAQMEIDVEKRWTLAAEEEQ